LGQEREFACGGIVWDEWPKLVVKVLQELAEQSRVGRVALGSGIDPGFAIAIQLRRVDGKESYLRVLEERRDEGSSGLFERDLDGGVGDLLRELGDPFMDGLRGLFQFRRDEAAVGKLEIEGMDLVGPIDPDLDDGLGWCGGRRGRLRSHGTFT
jgi:hypothetical protein